MNVSIIIVNYNTYELTSECIESIFKHTFDICFEVIVVDNGSCDNSVSKLSKDSRIHLIKSSTNLGFGKANNLGLTFAKGKYIFLLNSDTLVLNNAVKIFYDFAESSPSTVGFIGCVLKNEYMMPIHSYSQFPSIFNMLINIFKIYIRIIGLVKVAEHIQKEDYSKLPASVDYITGADLFVKRSTIEKFGFFDPDFFMYFEETELQERYRKVGYSSIIIDGPLIIHREGGSFNNYVSYNKRLLFTRGMFIYFKKKYNLLNYIFFRLLFFLFIPIILFSSKYNVKNKFNLIKQIILK